MTLDQFNKQYKYKSDKEKYGFIEVWDIPELQDDGFYYGDCESYCLFLKNNIGQFKDWDLYFCKINGNWHCILYKNGDVIDCNIKSVTTFEQYCKIYKVTEFKKYNWFTIFSKLLFAKIFKIIGRIND